MAIAASHASSALQLDLSDDEQLNVENVPEKKNESKAGSSGENSSEHKDKLDIADDLESRLAESQEKDGDNLVWSLDEMMNPSLMRQRI